MGMNINSDAPSPSAPAIAQWLTQNIAQLAQLPPAQIDAATPVVDFGVESLALLGLAGDLAAWLNRDISPTLLWEYPTIEALATYLDATPATPRRALVSLQTQGAAPPFYFVHAVTGTLFPYRHVLKHLGQEQMIYGFEVPFSDDEAAQVESIEALAAHYVEELRAHQPCGPYFSGGYSMGGLIAFEMARQLRAQGQTIGLLVLFDTLFPGLPRLLPSLTVWLRAHFGRFVKVPREQRLTYLHRRLQRVIARLRRVPLPPYSITRKMRHRRIHRCVCVCAMYPLAIAPAPSTARWYICERVKKLDGFRRRCGLASRDARPGSHAPGAGPTR